MKPRKGRSSIEKKKKRSNAVTRVAFLSDNPISNLGNPDCFASYVSWNKNIEKKKVPFVIQHFIKQNLQFFLNLYFGHLWVLRVKLALSINVT